MRFQNDNQKSILPKKQNYEKNIIICRSTNSYAILLLSISGAVFNFENDPPKQQETQSIANVFVHHPNLTSVFVGHSSCLGGGHGCAFSFQLLLHHPCVFFCLEHEGAHQHKHDRKGDHRKSDPMPEAQGKKVVFIEGREIAIN